MSSYLILSASEISKVDFSETLITSAETARFTVNRDKFIIKYEGKEPAFMSTIDWSEGPYTHEEMLDITKAEEWIIPTDD